MLHQQDFQAILLNVPFGSVNFPVVGHHFFGQRLVPHTQSGDRLLDCRYGGLTHFDQFIENQGQFGFVFVPDAHFEFLSPLFFGIVVV